MPPVVLLLISFLAPDLRAEVMKPSFLIQGTEGRDAALLSEILDERQVIHHLNARWLPTDEYKKYALVVIAGLPEEPAFERVRYDADDLVRVEEFLKAGGSLLLMGPATSVFGTGHGQKFLKRLLGRREPPRDDSGDVTTTLIPGHPWIQHLLPKEPSKDKETIEEEDLEQVEEETEEVAPGLLKDAELSTAPILYKQHPWLIRSKFHWLYPEKGNRILGKRTGKTALYQLPVGKGQIISTAWDIFRWENPELGESPGLGPQLQILRLICASLPLLNRNDYLKQRATVMGNDPFAWQRADGLLRPQTDKNGWYRERGLTPDIGPAGKEEAVNKIRIDTPMNEYESTSFQLSNFVSERTIRMSMSALKTDAGEQLPHNSVRIRIQRGFSPDILATALHTSGELFDYGPIESLDEARSIAEYLLTDNNSNLGEPIWLFDLNLGKTDAHGSEFKMAAGSHIALWLTYMPQEAIAPGVYEGSIRIEAQGGTQTVLPISLKVRKLKANVKALLQVTINSDEATLSLADLRAIEPPKSELKRPAYELNEANSKFAGPNATHEEIWFRLRLNDDFVPEIACSNLLTVMQKMSDSSSLIGLQVSGDERKRHSLTFRWGESFIACVALEKLRDSVGIARYYRALSRKAITTPPTPEAIKLKLNLKDLDIGSRSTLADFKKLHSRLLDLTEMISN